MQPSYTANDFKSDQYVRWCPGCGDHAVLNSIQKAMSEIGISPDNTAIISGIGCSSRLPYYVNSYGFHTIHGRASAIATGVKVANPELSVWQVTGDGDCLAIGGNHFIHTVRRNVDINIVLMNNGIYGLTKGQYAPTSRRGFISKSSPYGTVEDPFNAAELCFGAGGQFFARILDVDLKNSLEVLKLAAQHKGCSIVEALVNCVIFNNGTHKDVSAKDLRDENTIFLRHGERMIFGKNRDKGLVVDGFDLKVVTIGENGVTEDDILIHDAKCQDKTLHFKLGHMKGPEYPLALGIIRDAEAPVYDQDVYTQLKDVEQKHNYTSLGDFFKNLETWEIK